MNTHAGAIKGDGDSAGAIGEDRRMAQPTEGESPSRLPGDDGLSAGPIHQEEPPDQSSTREDRPSRLDDAVQALCDALSNGALVTDLEGHHVYANTPIA